MPTQANHYLILTDGTDTATFADGVGGATAFKLQSDWSPSVAQLRRSAMGGRGPYEDVAENWPFSVNGSTPAAATANLALLNRLLEKAERFERGEADAPVLVKFAPLGSTVAASGSPYQARVLGYGGGAALNLGSRYFDAPVAVSAGAYRINGLHLRFMRQGAWLLTEDSASSAATDNGELITFTMAGAINQPSPTRLTATNYGQYESSTRGFHGGFLLMGEPVGGSASITQLAAAGASLGAYTSVASDANSRNANMLRYTPAATSEVFSAALNPTLPSSTTLVAVFASIRHSTTVDFVVRMLLDSNIRQAMTPRVAIPAQATSYPRWWFLGIVPYKSGITPDLKLACKAASVSSSIDFDSLVLADAQAISALALNVPANDPVALANEKGTLDLDHRLLSAITPQVVEGSRAVPYAGDAVPTTSLATVYAMLLASGGGTSSAGNSWRQADTTSGAVLQNVWNLYRRMAYLVPE